MYIDYSDIVAHVILNVINIDQMLLMIFSNIHLYFSFTSRAIYGKLSIRLCAINQRHWK